MVESCPSAIFPARKSSFWMSKSQALPSGKHTKNYGKSPFSVGKSSINWPFQYSYVSLPEGMVPDCSSFFILLNAAGIPGLWRCVARGSADVQRSLEQGDRSDFARDLPSGKLT